MKLTYYQLEKQLSQKLLPAYIISGDEIVLKQEARQLIRQQAQQQGYSDRIRLLIESGFDWDELYNHLNCGSLFAVKRILELDLTHHLPNKLGGEMLKTYGNAPQPETILIIDIGKMDSKISKTAWLSALEKCGALITIWPLPHEQLPQWLMKRAKLHQLPLTLAHARIIAEYVEGNLIAASQVIDKLFLLCNGEAKQEINEQLIAATLQDESRYTLFEFVDHVIAGDALRTLHILQQLKSDKSEPILILWALTREIRLLAEFAMAIQAGQKLEQLLQQQRVFSKRQIAIRKFLNKHTAKDCWKFLTRAEEIDAVMKGAQYHHSIQTTVTQDNIWDSLQLLCLSLCEQQPIGS